MKTPDPKPALPCDCGGAFAVIWNAEKGAYEKKCTLCLKTEPMGRGKGLFGQKP